MPSSKLVLGSASALQQHQHQVLGSPGPGGDLADGHGEGGDLVRVVDAVLVGVGPVLEQDLHHLEVAVDAEVEDPGHEGGVAGPHLGVDGDATVGVSLADHLDELRLPLLGVWIVVSIRGRAGREESDPVVVVSSADIDVLLLEELRHGVRVVVGAGVVEGVAAVIVLHHGIGLVVQEQSGDLLYFILVFCSSLAGIYISNDFSCRRPFLTAWIIV